MVVHVRKVEGAAFRGAVFLCLISSIISAFIRSPSWKLGPIMGPAIPDLLIIGAITYCLLLPRQAWPRSRLIRVATLSVMSSMAIFISLLSSGAISYFETTTADIDWSTVFQFMSDYKTSAELTRGNMSPFYRILALHLVGYIVLLGCFCLFYPVERADDRVTYLPLSYQKTSFKPEGKRYASIINFLSKSTLIITFGATMFYLADYNTLLISFGKAFTRTFIYDYRPSIDINAYERFADCPTIQSTFEKAHNGQYVCANQSTPDFSFVRRDTNSSIKNVILVFLESARADLLPFKSDSPWVKEHLSEHIRKENPISPFFTELVKHGLFYEHVRTASTFTLKSLLGTLCSTVALPKNFLIEWKQLPYRKCLPQILKEAGWETLHIQSGTSAWDNQRENHLLLGFNEVVGFQQIDKGIVVGRHREKLQLNTNYFGREDIPLIPAMMDWMAEQRSKGKPAFISTLTNVNHDPYNLPYGFHSHKFIDHPNGKVNGFLNTVRYTDVYLKRLFDELLQSRLLEETLLVVVGDHGMALGEHGRVGTNENYSEEVIRVPLFFFSQNKDWQRAHPPQRVTKEHSTLDILPTILDMLAETGEVPQSTFMDYHEGESLLRQGRPHKTLITLVNPGAHSLVLYRDHLKAVIKDDSWARLFDLRSDPREEHPNTLQELRGEQRGWMKDQINLRNILLKKTHQLWNEPYGPRT